MALRKFRPLTPASRYKQTPAFTEITRSKPDKSLLEPKKRSGGRNNNGRLTSRHIGGGHKQKYRKVDFKRRKHDVPAEVVGIEYDPNRSARIALIKYTDGEQSYILAPEGLAAGARVVAGAEVAPDLGNSLPLRSIPLGTNIHNIELTPGRGGQVARSAGQQAILSNREGGYALVQHAFRGNSPDPRGLFRHHGPGRQRRSHERFQRQGRPHPLAGAPPACPRHGHEPDRSPDGWRSGQVQGRWRTSSPGEPVGPAGQGLQDPREIQDERPLHRRAAPRRNNLWADR